MKRIGDYTVVLIKPDGVKRGVMGDIISRFEKVGLTISAVKMIWVTKTHVGKHYTSDKKYLKSVGDKTLENYKKYGYDPLERLGTKDSIEIGKIVRKWNMDFITEGPVLAILITGPRVVEIVRKIVGSTFPFDSQPGTIRGDYSFDSAHFADQEKRAVANLIHASGTKEEARFERKLWFKEEEIYSY
ncbi:nucleoside-diphosphate kinase [Patescibacteria group bacterium]